MNSRAASTAAARQLSAELARFVADARSRPLGPVEELLRQGRVDEAIRFLLPSADGVGNAWAASYIEATQLLTASASRAIGRRQTFDVFSPRVSARVREERIRVISTLLQRTREAMHRAYLESADDPRGAARAMRQSVGLTEPQVTALATYRRGLGEAETGSLRLDLRDRRFDPSVRRAALADEPLAAGQITRMADNYGDRLLSARLDAVAEGEARAAAHAAMLDVLGQADEQPTLIWHTKGDGRVRDSHALMDDQEVPFGEPFTSGDGISLRYPHDPNAPASETAGCRCFLEASFSTPSG